MELRRVLFEFRLKQADLIREAMNEGLFLRQERICHLVNRKNLPFPDEILAIKAGLARLKVPGHVIESIPELQKSMLRWQSKRREHRNG